MAAGTDVVTRTLDAMATAVGAVSGMTARVYQGRKVFEDNENFENVIRALTAETQGALGLWLDGCTARGQTSPGEMNVVGLAGIRLPKDTSSDCNSLYELLRAIQRVLSLEATYQSIGSKPLEVTFAESEGPDDMAECDGISWWDFTMRYDIGLICGSV